MRGDLCMSDLQKYKAKQMEDPEFRKEYEAMRHEIEIGAQNVRHMTQLESNELASVKKGADCVNKY